MDHTAFPACFGLLLIILFVKKIREGSSVLSIFLRLSPFILRTCINRKNYDSTRLKQVGMARTGDIEYIIWL